MKKDYKKNHSSRVYQIIGILLLCFSLIAIFSTTTISWLKDESKTSTGSPNTLVVGTLDMDITKSFYFKNLALAPDTTYLTDNDGNSLSIAIKTSDKHTIDGAYVRIKFSTTRKLVGSQDYVDNSDLVKLNFLDNLTTSITYNDDSKNHWIYSADDDFYYYLGGVYDTNVLFNTGYQTTNSFINAYADAEVVFTFQVQAIQRQYGASAEVWNTSPQIFKDMANVESLIKNS